VHSLIFDLVYIGRFDHDELYTMPVPLRNFYYNKLVKKDKEQKDALDTANGIHESKAPKKH
jgi:hypothetical protein